MEYANAMETMVLWPVGLCQPEEPVAWKGNPGSRTPAAERPALRLGRNL
jgi:hypothetical protein